MNAQEARRKTEEAKIRLRNQQYEEIKKNINICADTGVSYYVHSFKIYEEVEANLKKEGYDIIHNIKVEW